MTSITRNRERYYSEIPFLPFAVILQEQARCEDDLRRRAKEARPWIGWRCSNDPLRHRAVEPKDAKRNNLVFIDSRSADNADAILLGDWERDFQLGLVMQRQDPKDPQLVDVDSKGMASRKRKRNMDLDVSHLIELELKMFEPYWKDEVGKAVHPLWVESMKRRRRGEPSLKSDWKDVVSLPWRPIKQIPLQIARELLEKPAFVPQGRDLIQNYCGVEGAHCLKQSKGYRNWQKAGTVKYVFTFEKNERRNETIQFNPRTQKEILAEIYRNGDEPQEYEFGH